MSPNFEARRPGTPEASWASSRLTRSPRLSLPGADRRIVVLVAHPDDETLGAGGFLAAAAAAGRRIDVVIATDGDASHPSSTTTTPADLARIRRAEAVGAMDRLAPSARLQFLGLPDGRLTQHGELLREELRTVADQQTLIVSTYRHDGHPDHEACAQAAADVAAELDIALWEMPIWAWHWADPSDDSASSPASSSAADFASDDGTTLPWGRLRRFDLDDAARSAKDVATGEYVSQNAPLSDQPGDEVVMTPEVLAHFERDFETFVVTAPASSPAYFDQLYSAAPDPWLLEERYYEQRKREIVLAALPRPRFRRAFEPGCAIGLYTVELARRCDEVVAWDVAQTALAQTLVRLQRADLAQGVQLAVNPVPEQWPDGQFDLVMIGELGYFITDIDALADRARSCLTFDGVLVACHWRHPVVEGPSTTEAVHAALGAGMHLLVDHVEEDFLLQIWSPRASSVARSSGMVT